MVGIKRNKYKGVIDLDFQLLACDMDMQVSDFILIPSAVLMDGIQQERFEKLVSLIKREWEFVSSFDDNTDLYTSAEMHIIIHEPPMEPLIVMFDGQYQRKIESIFDNL